MIDTCRIDWSDGPRTLIDAVDRLSFNVVEQNAGANDRRSSIAPYFRHG